MPETQTLPDISIRSQSIPLAGMRLLLPTTAIAEIVDWQTPAPVADAPDWLLGMMAWRGLQIPLLSFEAANGEAPGEVQRRGRVAVLNGIGGDPDLPFYAVQAQGIPHLTSADQHSLQAISEPESLLPLVSGIASLQDQEVLIPDLDKLEALIKSTGLCVSGSPEATD